MSSRAPSIEKIFGNLSKVGYQKSSEATTDYNCIAFAAGDVKRKWVGYRSLGFWPPGAKEGKHISALIDAFAKIGYEVCGNGESEAGFEKVVLYFERDKQEWTHAAKQLPNGKWTSKIGNLEDIVHDSPNALVGPDRDYGDIYGFMKRSRSAPPPILHSIRRDIKPHRRKHKKQS